MEKIIHGLDLPNEIADKNFEILMKELGITEEEIEKFDRFSQRYTTVCIFKIRITAINQDITRRK